MLLEFALQLGTDGRLPGLSTSAVPPVPSTAGEPYPYGPEHSGLVVEVVSASSRKTDRFTEPGLYAEAGLPLIWRVETDPEVLAFRLEAGSCVPAGQVRDCGLLPVPWGLAEVDVPRLLAGPPPG